MKKALLLAQFSTILASSAFAQTWEQLPYFYPKTIQSAPRIFASPDDKLVAGMSFNDAPKSHVSLDGGATWQQIFSDKPITSVEFGPDGRFYFIASKRYLTTSNYNIDTLFTSADGTTWHNAGYKLKGSGTSNKYNYVIADNNTLVFAEHSDLSGLYLSKSTDNAVTWTPTAMKAGPVACSPSADTIIVSVTSPWPGGIKYSHDGGATMHDATWAGSSPGGTIPLITPNGDVYAAGVGVIHKSTDGGMTFGPNLLSGHIGSIQEFMYGKNGKFYIRVTGSVTGIWETADFVTLNPITATLPGWASLSYMDMSDNYIYAITDTSLFRYSLGGTAAVTETRAVRPEVSVYPNPARDVLHVNVADGIRVDQMELTDQTGKVVAHAANNEKVMSLHSVADGIYFLKVSAGGAVNIKKVVVTN